MNSKELAQFLNGFRLLHGKEVEELAEALQKRFKTDYGFLRWLCDRRRPAAERVASVLRQLEAGVLPVEKLTATQLVPLAETYSKHHVLFDHLSIPSTSGAVQTSMEHCQVQTQSAGFEPDPQLCFYKNPNTRLENSRAMIVHLEYPADSHSPDHIQPGTEILFCLEGGVDLHMPEHGLIAPLRRHECVLFSAERHHYVVNPSKTEAAEVFCIRYFDFREGGPLRRRSNTFKKLSDTFHWDGSNVTKSELPRQVLAQWSEAKACFKIMEPLANSELGISFEDRRAFEHIFDPEGLRDFLKHFPNWKPRKLIKAINSREKKYSEWDLFSLGRGVVTGSADITLLREVAHAMKLPLILFAHFLVPQVPLLTFLREEDLLSSTSVSAFSTTEGLCYRLPHQTLALAPVAAHFLELKLGAITSLNNHPGTEIIVPYQGQIEVAFEGDRRKYRASSSRKEYVHYFSGIPHLVRQSGPEIAKCLLIRFYDDALEMPQALPGFKNPS